MYDDSMQICGRPWKLAIQEAIGNAIGAIILITPRMLNSDVVREVEIPAFLEKAESEGLKLFILFVDHSVVDQVNFSIVDNDGNQVTRKLTDYCGLNSPDEPLLDWSRRVQNKVLADVAKRIYQDLHQGRVKVAKIVRKPVPGRKTIHVIIERTVRHSPTGKYINKTKKLAVHWYESEELNENDMIEIQECRPKSKTKCHIFVRKI